MANIFNVGDSVLCTVEKDGNAVAKRGSVTSVRDNTISCFFIEIGTPYTLKAYAEVDNHCGLSRTTWNNFRRNLVTPYEVQGDKVYCKSASGTRFSVTIDALAECVDAPVYNGKVVCVDNEGQTHRYTVGKIYTFVDGYMENNHDTQPKSRPIKDFADWQDFSDCKWVEIVD